MRLLSKPAWPYLALLLTMTLSGIASSLPIESMWGINHLRFLPSVWWYLYWLVFAVVIGLTFVRTFDARLDLLVESISRGIFDHGVWPKLALAGVAVIIFYLFRMETHFLGDGYLILSLYGADTAPTPTWTESGAMWLVGVVQLLFGTPSQATALLTFQIVSVASGAVVVWNCMGIVAILCTGARTRILGLATTLCSGALLLYFGYVEYYALLWAAGTTFFYFGLKYVVDQRWFFFALLAVVAAAVLHLQAAYLVGGVVYLTVYKFMYVEGRFVWRPLFWLPIALLAAVCMATILWLYFTRIEFEIIFLPPFVGRPPTPEYAAFSFKHLLDIVNLMLIVLPGLGVLVLLALGCMKGARDSAVSAFLLWCCTGALLFLLVINPTFGLERDWDLMSFTLLPLALYLLHRTSSMDFMISGRFVVTYATVVLTITSCYLASNLAVGASEARFHSLLQYYGTKDRGGWTILANYYRDKGDSESSERIQSEMARTFPDYQELALTYAQLNIGNYSAAIAIADSLVRRFPYNPDYLQVYGNCLGKLGRFVESERYFKRAVSIRPRSATLKNELGQMYLKSGALVKALQTLRSAHKDDPKLTSVMEGIGLAFKNQGQLDSASAIADSLFGGDEHSPGGYLLKMLLAIQTNDTATAKACYVAFRQFGAKRSDYQKILSFYSDLGK